MASVIATDSMPPRRRARARREGRARCVGAKYRAAHRLFDRRLDEYQQAERSPVDGGGPERRLPDRLKLLAHLA